MTELEAEYTDMVKASLDELKRKIDEVYESFHGFLEFLKNTRDITVIGPARTSTDSFDFVFKINGFDNYASLVKYRVGVDYITVRTIVDPDAYGFVDSDLLHNPPVDNIIKYGTLYRDKCEAENKKQFMDMLSRVRETVEEHRDFVIQEQVDHSMTPEVFTAKVQDLLDGNTPYVFTDSLSKEQAIWQYYNKLSEKAKRHPRIWKMFFGS